MPAQDLIHQAVKNALIKDGWFITDDPFVIQFEDVRLFADLAAERPLAAQKGKRRIVVEVKSFVGESPIYEFEQAFGQYLLYRDFLSEMQETADYEVFLAVEDLIFDRLFQRTAIQLIIGRYRLGIVVINVSREEIIQWIEPMSINGSSAES